MELHWHMPWREHREVDWTAAAISGFAAGAVLMVLELVWAASMSSEGPWRTSQLIAALTMGSGVIAPGPPYTFDFGVVTVALLTHYALGIAFGLALGFVIGRFHDGTHLGTMQAIGAVYGLVLYLINFHVVTAVFPWFAEMRGWTALVGHLAFGVAGALLYWRLARPGGRPTPDV